MNPKLIPLIVGAAFALQIATGFSGIVSLLIIPFFFAEGEP